jgi:hypothetical protein
LSCGRVSLSAFTIALFVGASTSAIEDLLGGENGSSTGANTNNFDQKPEGLDA